MNQYDQPLARWGKYSVRRQALEMGRRNSPFAWDEDWRDIGGVGLLAGPGDTALLPACLVCRS